MINKPTAGASETRTLVAGTLRADDAKFQITGIAASYNTLSANLGGFREKIAPGAFSRSLRTRADVKMLFNHDPSKICGRTKSGTLVLSDSPEGLRFVCSLDKSNSDHVNFYAAIQRRDVDGCSFAFTVPPGGDQWDDADGTDGVYAIRTLKDVNLLDTSFCVFPAYPTGTSVDARAGRGHIDTQKSAAWIDNFHRAQAKALGKQIAADNARMLAAEDVSSMVRKALTDCLAAMPKPQAYIAHTDSHVFAVPQDLDPDLSDEDMLRKGAWYQYGVDEHGDVQLKAAPKNCEYMEGVSLQAAGVLSELRENAVWKKRMRSLAGIHG